MEHIPRHPVVLLAFNRPDFTAQVFERIRQWKPRHLVLVVDGPRSDHPEDVHLVDRVKEIIRNVDWPCQVTEDFASQNLGLKKRISSGLSSVFRFYDAAIILEDDCVPDLTFFAYVDELLDRYRDDQRVGIIGGTSRLRGKRASEYSYDFSDDVRIWGWATWARTWNEFISSGNLEASWDRESRHRIIQSFPPGPRRRGIARQVAKAAVLDSWALPFAIHCRASSYLSIVPEHNVVENIGFGARSTHTTFEDYVSRVETSALEFPLRHPPQVAHNPDVDRLENLMDARERVLYPLLHPWDTLGRFFRYALRRFASPAPRA